MGRASLALASLTIALASLTIASAQITTESSAQTTTEYFVSESPHWYAITHDPFCDELAAGTLPNATLTRYLVQDHKFLDAFVVLLASMIAHAPTLADRVPGAQFLALITGKENTYFERSFDALGLDAAARAAAPAPATSAFIGLMRRAAASGELHAMLAVLVVAEWSYLSWGERVVPRDGLSFLHLEWIDLHRGEYFAGVVAYLRGMLDALDLHASEMAIAKSYFDDAVKCEKDFWDMARGGEGEL